jgi:hypothetical protein
MLNNVSAISGFCEKCNKFRKRHCDGNRNTCMSILFDTIEALQQENERLNAALDKAVDMIGDNSRCPIDYRLRKCSDYETCLHCWKDWFLGGKNDA